MEVFDLTIIGLIQRADGTCALTVYFHNLDESCLVEVYRPPVAGTELSLLLNFTYTCVTDDEGRQTLFMKGDNSLIAVNYFNDIQFVDNWQDVVYAWMDDHPDELQEI